MEETVKLKCEKCGVEYTKPAKFIEYNNEHTNVFWRWSLAFCDKHRREKQDESLKELPEILKTLANTDLE